MYKVLLYCDAMDQYCTKLVNTHFISNKHKDMNREYKVE